MLTRDMSRKVGMTNAVAGIMSAPSTMLKYNRLPRNRYFANP